MSARTQFVTNDKGQRVAVLLDVKTYDRLRAAAEELADIRAYDRAKPRVMAEIKNGQVTTLAKFRRTKAAASAK